MEDKKYLLMKNGSAADFAAVPLLEIAEFSGSVLQAVKEENCRIASFFAVKDGEYSRLIAILADPAAHALRVTSAAVNRSYPSLTAHYAGFNRFERDIFESAAILPEGHPNLKPLRFPGGDVGSMPYFTMDGKAIHEVAVGPVHAGVIEPGHFRFECMGEMVYSLEISLGYQHRGVEKMLINGPDKRTAHLIETAAGDSSIASAWNYAKLIEALSNTTVAKEINDLRQIALELERCANHIGDLGALAGDVAFLPTASFCGRIRGDYLNMSADLAGNRFGRNFVIPGGCRYQLESSLAQKISGKLRKVMPELWNALDLMFNSPTVLDRLENTGCVSRKTACELGLVGVAGRACALDLDARKDLPGDFEVPQTVDAAEFSGDVLSRAKVRYCELKKSHEYLCAMLDRFSGAGMCTAPAEIGPLQKNAIAVAVTEAWRGELCHAALTGEDGKFRVVKITDPSMHNWEGLAMALRNEEIAHFPICNKSFNLSYCGHDL
jgi:Ni,Fe-hydrogenase III large subunit